MTSFLLSKNVSCSLSTVHNLLIKTKLSFIICFIHPSLKIIILKTNRKEKYNETLTMCLIAGECVEYIYYMYICIYYMYNIYI